MRQVCARALGSSYTYSLPLMAATIGLLAACASAPVHEDWIRIGVTTKDQVIARYGQPDLVIASPEGNIDVYRPTASRSSVPRIEIPTAQAGPFGSATTRMQLIDPGLGAKDLNDTVKERLRKEIRIRYDNRGVVQELSSP
ncbi:MAG: hypothetical protein E8D47_06900 [Nitrospira sp.]|nr:MAG: hypothetical protein E8D47_06900 [Nitrospira sp.]